MTAPQPPLVKVFLIVIVDMLAVAGGVAMYLRSDSILWLFVGLLLSASVTLIFLVPILRAAADAGNPAKKGDTLVQ